MSRVLLIGLDGLSWDVVEEFEDSLPTLTRLREQSVTATSLSTIPTLTCPALPALYTGQNPGSFGVFDFVKPDGSIANRTDVDVPALWDYLEAGDVRSVVAGMRTTHPAPEIDGVFISGVLSLEDEPHFVYPESYRDLARRFNDAGPDLNPMIDEGDREGIADGLIEQSDVMIDLCIELLEREDPEFGLFWLSPTDSAQHHLWGHDEQLSRFFRAFDRHLDSLLTEAEERGYDVIVTSDHGFGPAPVYDFHLNEWLYREGYLSVHGGSAGKALLDAGYVATERYTSDATKRRLLSAMDAVRGLFGSEDQPDADDDAGQEQVISPVDTLPGIDWNQTVAHLSTRKGWGINVDRDALSRDYDAVREEIIEKLREVQTPDGTPVIKDAWPGEEVYHGRYGDQVPDIVLLLADEVRARPSLTGSLFTDCKRSPRSIGDHTSARDGILLATGPDFREGVSLDPVEIYDVLPTVLHLLDVPVPDTADGRVLTELFAPDSEPGQRAVEQKQYEVEATVEEGEFGQGEGVEERLRDLGYID